MTDANSRRVVMPTPDLLYALCRLDVTERPVRVQVNPGGVPMWSVAMYADQSDNFFVINDRQAAGATVDLVLLPPGTSPGAAPVPAGAQTIGAPSGQVLLLMRLLVSDYERDRETLEAARRSLRCERL
jgi:uncharacterized membrane protein